LFQYFVGSGIRKLSIVFVRFRALLLHRLWDDYNNLNIPFTGNLFIGFKEALGYRESENKYKTVNSQLFR
jgi:hypothetical protein